MSSPNPAGYYSLDMPASIEKEIVELEYVETAELLNEITYTLTPCGTDDITTDDLSQEADDWINQRSPEQTISLVRWLAERLDYLAKGTHHP
jgi:hypothetical protein